MEADYERTGQGRRSSLYSRTTLQWMLISRINKMLAWKVILAVCLCGIRVAGLQQDASNPASLVDPSASQTAGIPETHSPIRDCRTLIRTMQRTEGPVTLEISGLIKCKQEDWDTPVIVSHNTSVIGCDYPCKPPVLVFPEKNKGIVVEEAIHLTFCGVVIKHKTQQDLKLSLLNWRVGKGGLIHFSKTGCHFDKCGDLPPRHNAALKDTQWEIGGDGRVEGLTDMSILCGRVDRETFYAEIQSSNCSGGKVDLHEKSVGLTSHTFDGLSPLVILPPILAVLLMVFCVIVCKNFRANSQDKEVKGGKEERPTLDVEKKQPTVPTPRPNCDGIARPGNLIGVDLSDVQLGPLLGRGAFGRVYRAMYRGHLIAIKFIFRNAAMVEGSNELLEVYLSKNLYHPNVVRTILHRSQDYGEELSVNTETTYASSDGDVFSYMASAYREKDDRSCRTWMMMEYCDQGSLAKAFEKRMFYKNRYMQTPNFLHIMLTALDVARAMKHLHSLDIIHGDLKGQNVLLKSVPGDPRGFVCKVGDFGLSRTLSGDTHIRTFTYGTVSHMPPELLSRGILTPATDVFSFGILFWELLSGHPIYPQKAPADILLEVVEGRRPKIAPHFPQPCVALLKECWRHDYRKRPSFREIYKKLVDMVRFCEKWTREINYVLPEENGEDVLEHSIGPPQLLQTDFSSSLEAGSAKSQASSGIAKSRQNLGSRSTKSINSYYAPFRHAAEEG